MDQCKITNFLHCKRCLAELPEGASPRDYQSIEVGIVGVDEDPLEIQIWCKRHQCNVMLITWEGERWSWMDDAKLGVRIGKET